MSDTGCCYCGTTTDELRPYGPGGALVCYPCGHATPERRAETEAAMAAVFGAAEAASPLGGVVLTEGGPNPANLELNRRCPVIVGETTVGRHTLSVACAKPMPCPVHGHRFGEGDRHMSAETLPDTTTWGRMYEALCDEWLSDDEDRDELAAHARICALITDDLTASLRRRAETAEQALREVAELHAYEGSFGGCRECSGVMEQAPWPCPTRQAADRVLASVKENPSDG